MSKETDAPRSLREMELEVEAEGREWTRRRLEGEAGKVIQREANYFAEHAKRMNYQTLDRRGWPIASGTAESASRSRKCRRKCPGQFWTCCGLRHLDALEEARDNGHWDKLWLTA